MTSKEIADKSRIYIIFAFVHFSSYWTGISTYLWGCLKNIDYDVEYYVTLITSPEINEHRTISDMCDRCAILLFKCMTNATQCTGLILGLHPANERRRYEVTSSLICWAQTENQPWCFRLGAHKPNRVSCLLCYMNVAMAVVILLHVPVCSICHVIILMSTVLIP